MPGKTDLPVRARPMGAVPASAPSAGPDEHGLGAAEAAARLRRDGPNELPSPRSRAGWRLFGEVLAEPMFLLLVGCGAVYLALGERSEALTLLVFVVLVVALTFVQQRRTAQALAGLRTLASPRALVLRDGAQVRVAGRELVVGDIVLLGEGDRVPADITLLASSNLSVDESMLTGESVPLAKHADADGADSVYAGTLVTQGSARGRVVATGPRGALGRIGASLAALGGEQTPVQRETGKVVKRVAAAGLALACVLALLYWRIEGDWLRGLLAGLTLAMAVLPEELPVILTLFLGLGARRLARAHVLARSIPAVELLGATTVLCVDKTGTLTSNHMELQRLWTEQDALVAMPATPAGLPESLHGLLEYARLASHRHALDPMDTAINSAALGLLAGTEHLHGDWTLVDDYPLSRQMLAMSRVWRAPDLREHLVAAKGAPESIVDLCHLDAARAALIAAQVARMAADGLRVLGVACARFDAAAPLPALQHAFDFDFLGLVALADPVRAEVPQAIAACRAAGIRVVMITGDHAATAAAIAREAGLRTRAAPVSGEAVAAMDDATLQATLATADVFCRIAAEQKLRLVQALRARGEIVAMTGDGVNDAPALKAANIGVAMGARGTDVAREAAALVLLEDDFSALLTAVRHGRRLFANLRKAIVFIVAVHLPIVGLSILPVMLGWPLLFQPIHILFLQMIIDPACSIVFEAEPDEPGAMRAPPRRADAPLFDRAVLVRGLLQGAGLLAMLMGLYAGLRATGGSDALARTVTYGALVLASLGLIYSNRAWRAGLWRGASASNRPFRWCCAAIVGLFAVVMGVPQLRGWFAFVVPDAASALAGAGVAVLSVLWSEVVKRMLDRREATYSDNSARRRPPA
jgi:Ca2+-transporting ATPase